MVHQKIFLIFLQDFFKTSRIQLQIKHEKNSLKISPFSLIIFFCQYFFIAKKQAKPGLRK
jgi:hypothetical protein